MTDPAIDQDLARALTLQRQGQVGASLKICMAAARRAPRDHRPMRLAGHLLFAQGRADGACKALGVALSLAPGSAELEAELGACLLAAGLPERALPHLERAGEARPDDPRVLAHRALTLRALRRIDQALPHLERAVALSPELPELHANLASTLESLGRNAAAAAAAERALDLDPGQPLARLVLAQLAKELGEPARARELLDALLADSPPAQERGWALMELGKVLDRLGEPSAAFEALESGQRLAMQQPAAQRVDRAHFPALLGTLANHYQTSRDQPGPDAPESLLEATPCPAFLLGFPRSGTTLMEQVLLGHPGVDSVDEVELLGETLRALPRTIGRELDYPQDLRSLTDRERIALRRDYHRRLLVSLGDERVQAAQRVVDKMPLNLAHVGFIRALFPEAPLLVMLRDPRDCCLSGFMQSFVPTVAMIHFHSVESSAALYAGVMNCWLHARQAPDTASRSLEIRYEDVVEDLEAQAREAVAHLGLAWDPAVLDYREGTAGRYISTPSRQDVARPMFTRARGRWRRYQTQLEPVLPGLAPYVGALGYPPA